MLTPIALSAQQLRGRVVLPDSITNVGAVIVELTDGTGAMQQRTLSAPDGSFTFRLRSAGTFGLRALRVGYRPTIVAPREVGAQDTQSRLVVLDPTPVTLGAVRVVAQEQCRLRPDSGQMVRQVWDEATKALIASRLAAAGAPVNAEWITYRRVSDPAERLVLKQTVERHSGPTATVFESRDADSLATRGYVVERGGAETYFAPDAEVLLGEPFAATHCLRLRAPGRDSAAYVGVAFEPTRRDRLRSDISGTFWLDRATAEVRALDFTYTGLSTGTEEAGAGGRVEFAHLPTGHWIINRWKLRLPAFAREGDGSGPRVRASGGSLVISAIQTNGGEVTRVSRDSATLFIGTLPAVRVSVATTDPRHSARGATVQLDGTDYEGVADSSGAAAIAQVLPGTYRASARTTLLEMAQVAPPTAEVSTQRAGSVETITLPTVAAVHRQACGKNAKDEPSGSLLYGFVRDSLGRGLADVAVSASWLPEGVSPDDTKAQTEGVAIRSNDAGQWRLCAVPRATRLSVRGESDAGLANSLFSLDGDEIVKELDLELRKGNAATSGAPVLLEFIVTGPEGFGLSEVSLDINAPRFSRRIRTNDKGLALLTNVPAGLIRVSTRRVGFAAGELAVLASPGRNTVPIHLSINNPPALDTVRVRGSGRVSSRLDEFEMRYRNRTASASFGRAEIEQRKPVEIWQLLVGVPGMKVVPNGGTLTVAMSNRGNRTPNVNDPTPVPCYMRVMLNGNPLPTQKNDFGYEMTDLSQLPPPELIYGIEVFTGPASIPLNFASIGLDRACGIIAVWSR